MARKPTTDATRIARTTTRATDLSVAVRTAQASLADPSVTPEARQALWVEVATLAGNIQRDTRILAGLGRGG